MRYIVHLLKNAAVLCTVALLCTSLHFSLSHPWAATNGPDAEHTCTSFAPLPPDLSAEAAPAPPDFVVTVDPSLKYIINGQQNPALTLNVGQSYTFDLTGFGGQHPFIINSSQTTTGGTLYAGPSSATTITFTPTAVMPTTIYYHCQVHFTAMTGTVNLVSSPILVSPKVYLEGAYNGAAPPMRDDLRVAGLVPTAQPYTALGYTFTGSFTGTISPLVLATVGNDAIVDWVIVELRDNTTPHTIVASRPALLQRDGDVVSTDGVSPVPFSVPAATYRVSVRHRNHLGVMTSGGIALTSSATPVDFTLASTATYGTNAEKTTGAVQAMWMGDTNFDGTLSYTGAANDRDPILVAIGSTTPTNSAPGYLGTDLNMNGAATYTGTGNDRDPILVNVGSTVPTTTRIQQLP